MRTVLFDFDFTIGDSSRGILECFRYSLESHDLPVPDDATILSTIGMSLKDAFALFAPSGCFETLRGRYIERGDEVMVAWAVVYPESPELVSALRSRGYKTGVVTSKFRRRIEGILQKEGLSHLFDVIVGSEDVSRHKPYPDAIELAIQQLGGDPASTTYVGDAVVDLEAALSAGVSFIGISTGPTPANELAVNGVPVVGKLEDILPFFPPAKED